MSIIRSPEVYEIEVDFFQQFKLEPEKVLDKGMCGEIVLAIPTQKPDVRRIVKKFCTDKEEDRQSNMRAFHAEVQYMQSFDHPFIMKCLVAGHCPRYLAIAMYYYERGTLDNYVGNLSADLIELCTIQVACALRYMHKNFVVHCDVKLDNIFLDSNFNAILGDFGLATELYPNQKTIAKRLCGGTQAYYAPERMGADDDKQLDPYKMDSFCLGVVLWSLLMELDPQMNINYYMEAKKKEDLPAHMRGLLLKLVERHPAKRLTVAGFLTRLRRDSIHRHVIDRN